MKYDNQSKKQTQQKNHRLIAAILCATLASASLTATSTAQAQSTTYDASMASGMSVAIPVAVVGLSAATAIAGLTSLTVKAVELSARGASVVVEGIANGISQTVEFTVDAVSGFAVGVGTVLSATAVTGGVLLYDGSRAVALMPNALGQNLMHHERLTY